jgi:hypothetical protein
MLAPKLNGPVGAAESVVERAGSLKKRRGRRPVRARGPAERIQEAELAACLPLALSARIRQRLDGVCRSAKLLVPETEALAADCIVGRARELEQGPSLLRLPLLNPKDPERRAAPRAAPLASLAEEGLRARVVHFHASPPPKQDAQVVAGIAPAATTGTLQQFGRFR